MEQGRRHSCACSPAWRSPPAAASRFWAATDVRSVCHELGYMAHPSLLYDEMSGMENLRYFARLYGISDDSRGCREHDRGRSRSRADAPGGAIFAGHAPEAVAGAGVAERSQNSAAGRAIFQRGCALGARDGHPAGADARRRQDDFRGDPPGRPCWKASPTNLSGWKRGRSRIAASELQPVETR